ncbi:MAG: DUF4124 domain-containing protein [Xanthomonadales bacterium]|jgi:hypothetical protein|nr:DUF4124 domain-containing protein [Xanthomonadales bacterium]
MPAFARTGISLLALVITVFSLDAAGAAGLCKWTDENGVVHYAETCPEDKDAQLVEIAPPPDPERVEEAKRRAQAMIQDRELRQAGRQAVQQDKQAVRSRPEISRSDKLNSCVEAMMDLHNLSEGEAMYFDKEGRLHDQFSIHSKSYTGERRYIEDDQHKALIRQKEELVQANCEQSREAIIARIAMLAERSDSEMCNRLYERVLQDKKYDRWTDMQELRGIEKTVLETCN